MDINEFIFFWQAVFRRFLHPEKDYLSFSLIYKKGQRSLDLVCKDQAELKFGFQHSRHSLPLLQAVKVIRLMVQVIGYQFLMKYHIIKIAIFMIRQ